MDEHTLEQNIAHKVRSEVGRVMKTARTWIQDALLTAMEIFVVPRVVLAMKSANASSGRSLDGEVLKHDLSASTEKFGPPQLNSSSGINSLTHLSRIDETRCYINNEGGRLAVNEKNSERQAYTHHSSMQFCIIISVHIFPMFFTARHFTKLKWF